MAAQTLIRVTFVVGLWIFVGNSGVVSFGHAGFMAIGAYCSAWLTLRPQMKGMFLPDLPPWLASAEWPHLPATVVSGLLAALVALIVAAAIYANSASGLALRATREDEVAAAASGVNMYRHRLLSLVISGVLNPNSFYLGITFITLAILVVGGIGSLSGADRRAGPLRARD